MCNQPLYIEYNWFTFRFRGRHRNRGFSWAVTQTKNEIVLLNPCHLIIYRSHRHFKLYALNYWRISQINYVYISWRKVVCINRRQLYCLYICNCSFLKPNKIYFMNTYRSGATNMATSKTFESSRTPILAKHVTKKNHNNYFLSWRRGCKASNYHEDARKFFYCVILGRYTFLYDIIDNVSYWLDQKIAALIGSGRYTWVVSIKIRLIQ